MKLFVVTAVSVLSWSQAMASQIIYEFSLTYTDLAAEANSVHGTFTITPLSSAYADFGNFSQLEVVSSLISINGDLLTVSRANVLQIANAGAIIGSVNLTTSRPFYEYFVGFNLFFTSGEANVDVLQLPGGVFSGARAGFSYSSLGLTDGFNVTEVSVQKVLEPAMSVMFVITVVLLFSNIMRSGQSARLSNRCTASQLRDT